MSPTKLSRFFNNVRKFIAGRPSKRNGPPAKHAVQRTALPPPYKRKNKTAYTYQEKRQLLLAVNTIGVSHWKTILKTYPLVFQNRDNVGVKDLYLQLVKDEHAVKGYTPSDTHDCFTEKALVDFHLEQGQKDDILNDGTVYSIRRERVPFDDAESRLILLGVNTVYRMTHKPWVFILNAHWEEFERNERTAVNLKDRYRTMKRKGLAIDLNHLEEGQDCFTEAGRNKYSLAEGEQDPALNGEGNEEEEEQRGDRENGVPLIVSI